MNEDAHHQVLEKGGHCSEILLNESTAHGRIQKSINETGNKEISFSNPGDIEIVIYI